MTDHAANSSTPPVNTPPTNVTGQSAAAAPEVVSTLDTPEAIAEAQLPIDGPMDAPIDAEDGIAELPAKQHASLWSAVTHNLHNLSDTVSNRANQVGKAARSTATGVGGAIAHTTLKAGLQAGKAAVGLGEITAKQTQQLLTQATQGAGEAAAFVGNNPVLRKVGTRLNWGWLLDATNQVDLVKAEAAVQDLRRQHPDHSPSQIAHTLMMQKAVYAGGVGLATSMIPGVATALLTVDLAANMALQAEMVYQIAAAYGLDLRDPARKGEILAIFGVALGGGRALKLGLGLLRNTPIAGALVGASANAAMLYSLGYAACRFYEAQLNEDVSDAKLSEVQQASQEYLQVAIAQQAIMDQVLVHMILAGTDKRSWDEILPTLKTLNLHPSSLKTIAENLQNPQPLYLLLNQLNPDFAVPLLTQSRKIACQNGKVTPQEAKILESIAEKFEIESSDYGACQDDAR
ncbi:MULTISPECIES: hypothetical protein [Trichocoleus]|uniref:EcsC family protein n=1 Tax=Trichocoleus desertorum GB2-A4 TaxID=2933944 RepID=A0ABV0J1S3_9CYAN|nr:hypothetical protein [Trichocoleus sp. FACHB-46]MBD1860344.1 hypothetical protein [Trichocoleus sp. FACHB-46]